MLEKSMATLNGLAPELYQVAEAMAVASLASALGEDLLPPRKAVETVLQHKEAETEDWLRALSGSVASIGAIQKLGYKLQGPSSDLPAGQAISSGQRTIHGGSHDRGSSRNDT